MADISCQHIEARLSIEIIGKRLGLIVGLREPAQISNRIGNAKILQPTASDYMDRVKLRARIAVRTDCLDVQNESGKISQFAAQYYIHTIGAGSFSQSDGVELRRARLIFISGTGTLLLTIKKRI